MKSGVINLVWPPKPRVVGSIPASRAKLGNATLRGGFFVPKIPQRDKHLREFSLRRVSSCTATSRDFKGFRGGFEVTISRVETLGSREIPCKTWAYALCWEHLLRHMRRLARERAYISAR